MAFQVANNLRFRRTFGRIRKIIDLPYLIEIQKNSYELFLQKDVAPMERQSMGLQEVFKSVFPIKDFNETASLEFVSFSLGEPKYDVEECHQRGMTFAAPLKVTVQLVLWDVDQQTGSRSIKNVKEQEVYFGEIPLMTINGTFMINGTERVIVSQLHRSPGVFFEHDKGKTHASGKLLYSARVIPYRGSWVDLEFDPRDVLYVRIDRRRKFHATVLLRALGMTTEDLLNYYYQSDTIVFDGRKPALLFNPGHLINAKVSADVRDPKSNDIIVKEGKKFTRPILRQMEAAKMKQVPMVWEDILGRVAAHDIVDPQTKEVLVECNQEITQEKLDLIRDKGIHQIDVLFIDESSVGPYLRNTLLQDRIKSPQDAILEIYRRLRPGDPPTVESATNFFNNLFFNPDRYDLSKVGRLKLNHRLKLNVPLEQGTLAQGRYSRSRALLDGAQKRQRIGGRYRPSGQSPGARGRRACRKPLPCRSGAHGASDQRKDELAGHRNFDAAGADQLQTGFSGAQGIFRFEPAVAIHGSNQSAIGDHSQAATLSSWARAV